LKSDIQKEFDTIRLKLYEQTKHMTASEVIYYYNKIALEAKK
jgi:hypothetical protein